MAKSDPTLLPATKSDSNPTLLPVLHAHAAGIDIGSRTHAVCVGPDPDKDVREFETFTIDLQALADWLKERGVTTIAMESTGVYWIPLFELLSARGFEVILVDPRQTRRPGRPKTDRLDCQWIYRLHSCALLHAAFRPDDPICELRSYMRQATTLIRDSSRCIHHMQKAMELMNIKLTEVVTHVTGKTGFAIMRAILKGERDPHKLASFRDRRCKMSAETIAKALIGNWRPEHLFALKQAIQSWDFFQEQLRACEKHLEACLRRLPKKQPDRVVPPRARNRVPDHNAPHFDARELLAPILGCDLTAIEGIENSTALIITSEIGADVDKFPTEKHFGSWLGLAPKAKRSGRRRKDRITPGAHRIALALRMAAMTLHRSQTAIGAFLRRLKGRLGAPKAYTATAYKLARLIWKMLKHGTEYVVKGLAEYEARFRERSLHALKRKAQSLGYELVPVPTT
jgi:transposase